MNQHTSIILFIIFFFTNYILSYGTRYSTTHPESICNDGSNAIYYIDDPQITEISGKKWMIYFEGGGSCYDISGCQSRWDGVNSNRLMTDVSGGCPNPANAKGIFSRDCGENVFCEWTHVFFHYCSSDFYTGDRDASVESGNWHFKGKKIVENVFKDLVELRGMNGVDEVVIVGTSAGCIGAYQNGDRIKDYLKSVNPDIKFRMVLDSCWFHGPDCVAGRTNCVTSKMMVSGNDLWNSQPVDACVNDLQNKTMKNTCLWSHVVAPYVKTEHIILAFLYDSIQSGNDGLIAPMDSTELSFLSERGQTSVCDFKGILEPRNIPVWSAGCDRHVMSKSLGYSTTKVNGVTAAKTVRDWIVDDTVSFIYDECIDPITCNTDCPWTKAYDDPYTIDTSGFECPQYPIVSDDDDDDGVKNLDFLYYVIPLSVSGLIFIIIIIAVVILIFRRKFRDNRYRKELSDELEKIN